MVNTITNSNNVCDVLRRFADWLALESSETKESVAADFDALLDALLDEDAFGTEGQSDPRGDHRG